MPHDTRSRVTAEGGTRLEYTARFDGKPYPVKSTVDGKPSGNQGAVTWRKIDDYTYENTAMLKGNALTTTRVVVSCNGKTRTNTVTAMDAQGRTHQCRRTLLSGLAILVLKKWRE